MLSQEIFNISTTHHFEKLALEVFSYQFQHNNVYRAFCSYLKKSPEKVTTVKDIPFLPIQFFKSHAVVSGTEPIEQVFTSSGTTGAQTSRHLVANLELYRGSFLNAFHYFYGNPSDYTILALLPSYLERSGSSLIFMVDELIKQSGKPHSGFYLHNLDELAKKLLQLEASEEKTILIGVSFALLDLVEKHHFSLKNTIVMETGGMKGRRKELVREELHQLLKEGFGLPKIHSEYGMTELLSQAYSTGNGVFKCPPWMKVYVRDTEDALQPLPFGKSGGLNIIDLANLNSCSFIATQDLGRVFSDGSFEVIGRFDNADIRGCNLMVL